jgi:hypothetical protein
MELSGQFPAPVALLPDKQTKPPTVESCLGPTTSLDTYTREFLVPTTKQTRFLRSFTPQPTNHIGSAT